MALPFEKLRRRDSSALPGQCSQVVAYGARQEERAAHYDAAVFSFGPAPSLGQGFAPVRVCGNIAIAGLTKFGCEGVGRQSARRRCDGRDCADE